MDAMHRCATRGLKDNFKLMDATHRCATRIIILIIQSLESKYILLPFESHVEPCATHMINLKHLIGW